MPPGRLIVGESGIYEPADLDRLAAAGARCFLVGESLMKASDVAAATRKLMRLPDLSHVDTSAIKQYVAQTQNQTPVQFLLNIIPQTMAGAFAEGNVLQVLFISVLFGFALTKVGEAGKPIVRTIEVASHALFRVVGIVMWAAPLGAFGAIAFTVGKLSDCASPAI